jgi:hypothetical protein
MKTILGLLGIVAVAFLAVLAWNWWAGNNTQLSVIYPAENAELAGNTVPVRLSASPGLRDKLTSSNSQVEIVTYLDGKEVARGKNLEYNLTSVPPGEHRLEIALSDKTSTNGVSLSVVPKPVSFTLGGGSGAANPLPPASNSLNGVYGNQPTAPDSNIAAPVATAAPDTNPVPAAPVATQAPVQVPASGNGGGARVGAIAQPAGESLAASNAAVHPGAANEPARQAALAGNQTSLPVASTQPNSQAVISAETSNPVNPESPMSGVFRGIFAFYIAGFIVGLAVILFLKHRQGNVL